jgi:vitamin B12 transporter
MNRSHLLVAAMLFALPSLLHAQVQDSVATFHEVTIIDYRSESKTGAWAPTLQSTIISKEELMQLPVSTVQEALGFISGVQLSQRGPLGAQADVSVLGGTFEQTLVLVNGIPMRDPQTGHHQMNLPVDLTQVERIEVYKGSAARLYGANALTGAINIITKKAGSEGISGDAFVYFPRANSKEDDTTYYAASVAANVGIPTSYGGHSLHLSTIQSNGYRFNSENEQLKIGYNGDYNLGRGTLRVIGGMLNNAFGANSFYAAPFDVNAYEKVNTYFGGANYTQRVGKWTIAPSIFYRYNHDNYVFIRERPEVYENNHYSTSAGGRVTASNTHKWGTSKLGIDSRTELIRSNNLGRHERYYHSVFAEHAYNFDFGLKLSGGVNIQTSNEFGPKVYPGLEASYTHKRSTFYGTVGTGNRMPSFTDLYYEDRATVGNDFLQVERANNYHIGYARTGEYWFFELSGFYRETFDFIDFVKDRDSIKFSPQNFTAVRFRGVESSLTYRFGSAQTAGSFLKMARFSYTLLDGTVAQDINLDSRYALGHFRHQFTAQITIELFKNLTYTIAFRSINFFDERVENPTPRLLDLRFRYSKGPIQVYADIMNSLDARYNEKGTIPMPGRGVRFGVSYRLVKK